MDGLVKLVPLALVEMIGADGELMPSRASESKNDVGRPSDSPILSDDGPDLKELSIADFRIAPVKSLIVRRGLSLRSRERTWRLTMNARVLLIVTAAPIAIALTMWLTSNVG
jgi:hypothetical protein